MIFQDPPCRYTKITSREKMKNSEHIQYTANRVSRKERLSLKTKVNNNQNIQKTKEAQKYLFRFYIALLIVGIIAGGILKRTKKEFYSNTEQKTVSISSKKTVLISFIKEKERYGLSILLRNNSSKPWHIKNIIVKSKNNSSVLIHSFSAEIPSKGFESEFVPIENSISSIKDINITIE
ncbi:MAG: hypothetical protein ACRCTQ_01965 [Brevinemataceae bacterium]